MTLTIATEVSGDRMNAVNVVGLIICMSGISVHVISKALDGKYCLKLKSQPHEPHSRYALAQYQTIIKNSSNFLAHIIYVF